MRMFLCVRVCVCVFVIMCFIEYKDESYGIRKNSTIIVRRVSVRRGRKLRLFEDLPSVEEVNDPAGAGEGATDAFGGSVYSDPKARAEEDRMKQFVAQASVAGYVVGLVGRLGGWTLLLTLLLA